MNRIPDEWIGKTPDSKVPDRVKVRVFERHGGRCHISGRLIRAGEAWDIEHVIAICNGGEHRESNMAPALVQPHKAKTVADLAEKSRNYRKRKAHLGIRKPSKFACSRNSRWKKKIDGSVVLR